MISLSVPNISGNEWKYVKECLDTEWVSSAGKYVNLFESKIEDFTKAKHAIACVNGTSALQVSLRLAGVSPGSEVITSTLTFIAPVNSIIYNQASPVFMDCDDYYNIDVEKTIEFIEKKTIFKNGMSYNKTTNAHISAIIPVHVWGNAVYLDDLVKICRERNISIVEDSSESLGTFYTSGKYSGKHTGTIGKIGNLSFNGNKIITCGGGGMILTNDTLIAEKAKYLTTQAKDDPIRYIHNEVGYNFRLTNIQSALGVAQLENLNEFLVKKKKIHRTYYEKFKPIENFSILAGPSYAENNYWLNILQINSLKPLETLENLIKKLASNNIQTRPVWALNHLQKPFRKFQNYKIDKSNSLIENSLCLPSSSNLKEEDIDTVINAIND